ncbi:hypothetical protein [Streptomyces sp. NPDC088925]|uniref:hypothetical protein n=1 Tax=Streptomyces sp. NPDC088925 TaxID=3365914 RepID=UPI0038262AB1
MTDTPDADLRERVLRVLRSTPVPGLPPGLGLPVHHRPGETGYYSWCALCTGDVGTLADAILNATGADSGLRERIAAAIRAESSRVDDLALADAVLAVLPSRAVGCAWPTCLPEAAQEELVAEVTSEERGMRATPAPADRAAEVERLQGEVLDLRAEQAKLQDLLRAENARADAAIAREEVAEQSELEARSDRAAVRAVSRVAQMADAWEQQLPETIRTAAAVDAIRHALEGAEPKAAPTDRAAVLREAIPVWEAVYEPGNVSDYLIGYANSEAAAKGAAEAWLRSQKDEVGSLEWVLEDQLASGRYERWYELLEHHPGNVEIGPGIIVRRLADETPGGDR